MVTPFAKDGSVDYGRLQAIVDEQVAGGVEGICAVGTTGESPTLDHAEHHKVIEKTIEFAQGKVKIIAGTGANSTAEAISLTKAAIAAGGSDATLQVTPYYNKPNAEGIYRHFIKIRISCHSGQSKNLQLLFCCQCQQNYYYNYKDIEKTHVSCIKK